VFPKFARISGTIPFLEPELHLIDLKFVIRTDVVNKKAQTIIISACSFLLLVAVVVGKLVKQGVIDTDKIFEKEPEKSAVEKSSNQNSGSKSIGTASTFDYTEEHNFTTVLLKEGAEYELPYATVDNKDDQRMLFRFDGYEITKKRGDFDLCGLWKEEEKHDATGTISSQHSYIVAKVTIINKGEQTKEIALNNLRLLFGKENGAELRSYNSDNADSKRTDYFFVDIEPGKTYTYNLAYVAKDSILEQYKNDILLYTTTSGYWEKYVPVIEKKEGK
jgi:hypothetical protein